jgi:large subunit ribosomal protein L9
MRVVLRSDVEKVGHRGDIVDVADGYARNFLVPRGLALVATKGITAQAAAMRAARDRIDAKNREAAQAVATILVGKTVRIEARSGAEGKLFGSVTTPEIVQAVADQTEVTIERKQVEHHEPIKTIGLHPVGLKLHPTVRIELSVEVVAESE